MRRVNSRQHVSGVAVTLVLLLSGHSAIAAEPDVTDDFRPALPMIAKREVQLIRPSDEPPDAMATSLFAKSIEDLHHRGGGRLVVPPGVWISGPIH